MTDIATRTVYQGFADNKAWVYQDISKQEGRQTITLDIDKFVQNTHYPKGFIPSGILLGKVTATGKYGPYDKDATDGRQTPAGFLWNYCDVAPGQKISVQALWVGNGVVRENKLPIPASVDAAAKTALGWFKFVTV